MGDEKRRKHFVKFLGISAIVGVLILLSAEHLDASCNHMIGTVVQTRDCGGFYCESAACLDCGFACGNQCACGYSSCWCDSWLMSIGVCWNNTCDGTGTALGIDPDALDRADDVYALSELGISIETNVRSAHCGPRIATPPRTVENVTGS